MKKTTKIFFTIIMLMIVLISKESLAQRPNWSWAKQIGGIIHDQANCTSTDSSSNVLTAGAFSGTIDFEAGAGTFNLSPAVNFDIFTSKFNDSDIAIVRYLHDHSHRCLYTYPLSSTL